LGGFPWLLVAQQYLDEGDGIARHRQPAVGPPIDRVRRNPEMGGEYPLRHVKRFQCGSQFVGGHIAALAAATPTAVSHSKGIGQVIVKLAASMNTAAKMASRQPLWVFFIVGRSLSIAVDRIEDKYATYHLQEKKDTCRIF
jgi:hypothetical protein